MYVQSAAILSRTKSPYFRFLSAPPNAAAFIVLTLVVAVLSAIYSTYRYYLVFPNEPLFELANGYGPVLHSLYATGRYGMCTPYVPDPAWWEYFFGKNLNCLITHRLPSITYFLLLLTKISTNLYFMTIVKDTIFYMISLYALLRLASEYGLTFLQVSLCFAALFLTRANAAIAASLAEEEGYIYHLLPLLFVILFLVRQQTRADVAVAALIVGTLYLTKSSLFIVCTLAALAALVRRPGSEATGWVRALPLAAVVAAALGWGLFSLSETGRFAIGPAMSSINGANFYKGNNPYTEAYYPRLHVDRMDFDDVTKPEIAFGNEWELDDYYKRKALEFIRENPESELRLLLVRLRVAFLSIGQFAIVPERGQVSGLVLSMIPTRIIFLLALACAVAAASRGGASGRWAACGFLGLVAAYSAPYLAAFVWYRHLMPVYGTAVFYLAAQWGAAGPVLPFLPAEVQHGVGGRAATG